MTCQNSQKGVGKDRLQLVNIERVALASNKKLGNHDIQGQKKNYTHIAVQVAFRRKPKRLRLFSHNKKT